MSAQIKEVAPLLSKGDDCG